MRLNGSFAQFPSAAKARRSRDGAPGKPTGFFLDEPAGVGYCFSELKRPARRFSAPGWRLRLVRSEKGGQAIENKQFCEMGPFASPMIPTTYDQLAKPFVSLREMNPLAFAGFSASSRSKTRWREINGGFGARAADVTRKWRRKPLEPLKTDSEMAPQARSRRAGEPIGIIRPNRDFSNGL
jgi:hypothetical protein